MKRFGLFGSGIGYSLSPAVHGGIYRILGIEAEYRIYDFALGDFEVGLSRVSELDGFNVTKPFKEQVVPFINEVDCSAVNSVVCSGGRLVRGFQTDGGGFDFALRNVDLKGKEVLLLGAGGAARSIAEVIVARGGLLSVFNRTPSRAMALVRDCGGNLFLGGSPHVIVSAVSVADKLVLPKNVMLDRTSFVFDSVYRDTPLLRLARSMGIACADGKEMLVYQALLTEKVWCGVEPSVELVRELVRLIS